MEVTPPSDMIKLGNELTIISMLGGSGWGLYRWRKARQDRKNARQEAKRDKLEELTSDVKVILAKIESSENNSKERHNEVTRRLDAVEAKIESHILNTHGVKL